VPPLDAAARHSVTETLEADPFAAGVRDTLARLRTETDFDPQVLVERVFAAPATPERSLRVASVLFQDGARGEAYAVLVHGLSIDTADALTTEMVIELLPLVVLEGLAAVAEARGEHDVAGILEAVAGVSAGS
jgi:hypothetical protein